MTSNYIWEEEEMRPWVLLLLGNENDNRNIIAHTTLQKVAADESTYEKTSLAMQTTIWTL